MKLLKWAFIIWVVCATLLFGLALHTDSHSKTQVHTFCAYNRIFVEFEEGNSKWGTIMLDYSGKPIPCKEGDVEDLPINTKEII